jgi:hypothetical protein
MRKIELNRCDKMLKAIAGRVNRGDLKAVMVALKIAERRARLAGLDSPVDVKLSGTGEGGAVSIELFRKMVDDAKTDVATGYPRTVRPEADLITRASGNGGDGNGMGPLVGRPVAAHGESTASDLKRCRLAPEIVLVPAAHKLLDYARIAGIVSPIHSK